MDSYNRPTRDSRRHIVLVGVAILASLLALWALFFRDDSPPLVTKAVVVLQGDSKVTGIVTFHQASRNGPVTVTGDVKNLDANASRGFHVHQYGDATNGCLSAGPHFNPYQKSHGAPAASERHVGDLGNIISDASGSAKFAFKDSLISLNGPLSIIGRAVVVHAGSDDLGLGKNEESLKTGNAGARAACGVIALA